jgi:diguanylate cyclase (GGDEF)-like protein
MSQRPPEISFRTLARDLLRRREDPYAADDKGIARRIAGVVSCVTALMGIAFMPLDPPTAAIGSAGWAVAAAIAIGFGVGARRLFDMRQNVSWNELTGLSYLGIASVLAMTWLAGGGLTPYAALYPVIVAGSALNPPRRALAFIVTCAAAACAPIAFGAPATPIVTATLSWTAVGLLIVVGADGVRQQGLALVAGERAARKLARADALTGMGNRRAFEETLAAELARVRRTPAPLSVAILDLDGLKTINDCLGHLEGDSCLRQVATALELAVRGSDRAYRWAGDEFALLLPDTTAAEAAAVCERARARTAATAHTSQGEPLWVSYGVAQLEEGDPAALIEEADRALLAYKAARPALPNPGDPKRR